MLEFVKRKMKKIEIFFKFLTKSNIFIKIVDSRQSLVASSR